MLDFGVKGLGFMKKIKNADSPFGKVKIVNDFLPPPDALFPKEHLTKITIAIDEKTLIQFKKIAEKTGHKYQRMMREVLRIYAERYSA